MVRNVYHVMSQAWRSDARAFPWRVVKVVNNRQIRKQMRKSRTKDAAIRYAKRLAKQRGTIGQVIVHGKNGRIQTEWTYGADPPKRKG